MIIGLFGEDSRFFLYKYQASVIPIHTTKWMKIDMKVALFVSEGGFCITDE